MKTHIHHLVMLSALALPIGFFAGCAADPGTMHSASVSNEWHPYNGPADGPYHLIGMQVRTVASANEMNMANAPMAADPPQEMIWFDGVPDGQYFLSGRAIEESRATNGELDSARSGNWNRKIYYNIDTTTDALW